MWLPTCFSLMLNTVQHVTRTKPNPFLLIANSRLARNVVFFLPGDSPASEFYMPTFRNTVAHIFFLRTPPMKMEPSVPKRRHITFRGRGITRNKEFNKSISDHHVRKQQDSVMTQRTHLCTALDKWRRRQLQTITDFSLMTEPNR